MSEYKELEKVLNEYVRLLSRLEGVPPPKVEIHDIPEIADAFYYRNKIIYTTGELFARAAIQLSPIHEFGHYVADIRGITNDEEIAEKILSKYEYNPEVVEFYKKHVHPVFIRAQKVLQNELETRGIMPKSWLELSSEEREKFEMELYRKRGDQNE